MRTPLVLGTCLLVALALVVGVVFLNRTPALPPVSGQVRAQTSQDWASIPFENGECAVVNNTWNRAAAGQGFEQSVFLEDSSGNTIIGWRWRAPWHLLPRLVSLWGVSAVPASRKDITHEIMIWTNHAGQSPAGQRVDSMKVDGNTYDVYVEKHQTDASGENANTWTYVAFVAQRPVSHGPIEIHAFIDYLLRRGTLHDTDYLTSLEFGTEISQGSGLSEIHDFAIKLE
jgi:hypothetical protein